MSLLAVEDLSVSYGSVPAVRRASLEVRRGGALAVLGLNGAGKSSLLLGIVGAVKSTGTVRFQDCDVSRWRVDRRVRAGIALVPEGRHVIANLTVAENLRLGGFALSKREMAEALTRVEAMFPLLRERADAKGGTLSGGQQQMLAIARAMLTAPSLLLLDEPSLGLAPIVVEEVYAQLEHLRAEGTTIVLVEQQVHRALAFVDEALVLKLGDVVWRGSTGGAATDELVAHAYGRSAAA